MELNLLGSTPKGGMPTAPATRSLPPGIAADPLVALRRSIATAATAKPKGAPKPQRPPPWASQGAAGGAAVAPGGFLFGGGGPPQQAFDPEEAPEASFGNGGFPVSMPAAGMSSMAAMMQNPMAAFSQMPSWGNSGWGNSGWDNSGSSWYQNPFAGMQPSQLSAMATQMENDALVSMASQMLQHMPVVEDSLPSKVPSVRASADYSTGPAFDKDALDRAAAISAATFLATQQQELAAQQKELETQKKEFAAQKQALEAQRSRQTQQQEQQPQHQQPSTQTPSPALKQAQKQPQRTPQVQQPEHKEASRTSTKRSSSAAGNEAVEVLQKRSKQADGQSANLSRPPSGARPASGTTRRATVQSFAEGDLVQYWSDTKKTWIDTRIKAVNLGLDGAVSTYDIAGKAGAQADKLRKRPAAQELNSEGASPGAPRKTVAFAAAGGSKPPQVAEAKAKLRQMLLRPGAMRRPSAGSFAVGDKVQYYSIGQKKWCNTQVNGVHLRE
ncbi:unnamed protein product, partial [Polarella glacialis]